MRQTGRRILFFLAVAATSTLAQDHPYTVSISGSFTTSARLFYNPNDPDDLIRNQHLSLDNVFGYGIDVRRSLGGGSVQLGISAEYISKTESFDAPVTSQTSVAVQDGFQSIPVELTGYFVIPFSSEKAQLYMGGGGGVYFGRRSYQKAGVASRTISRDTGFGIHVLGGFHYNIVRDWGIRAELRFRDIQFSTSNAFPSSYTYYNSTYVQFDSKPVDSRINIDGMTLSLGATFRF